jgi:hypothetical protein
MPFIHLKSLPFEKPVEMKAVLEGYARRESGRTSFMKPKSLGARYSHLGIFPVKLFVGNPRLSSWRESQAEEIMLYFCTSK